MVLTAYAALSLATNSSCHRHRRISGIPKPGWARNTSADLTPATGARTTRFCRTRPVFAERLRRVWYPSAEASTKKEAAPFVCALCGRSRETRPTITISRPALPRPSHPIPTSVTIMIRPSLRDETAGVLVLIWVRRKQEYFCWRDSTGVLLICPSCKKLQRPG